MSQRVFLNQDLAFIPEAVRANGPLFDALGDTREPEQHTFFVVSLDLAWQVLSYTAGSSVLIGAELVVPLLPVQRAAFEAVANLRYLARHPDRHVEATIYQAYTYLRDLADFPDDKALTDERHAILSRMRPAVVNTAKTRAERKPRTWSGRGFAAVAASAGLTNTGRLWTYLSGRSHSGRVGLNVRFGAVSGETQDLNLGVDLSPEEAELHANFARKCLHAAFRCIWDLVDSPPVRLPTPDPAAFGRTA